MVNRRSDPDERKMSITVAADKLGVSINTVRRWVDSGTLAGWRTNPEQPGATRWVDADAVDRILADRKRQANGPKLMITVGMLKGGVGKTTTAVFLASILAGEGARVLLVDADPGSQSAIDWYNRAVDAGEQPLYELQPWSTNDLAARVKAIAPSYDHVIIDAGGETPRLFRLACSVSRQLIIPTAPEKAQLSRLPASFEAAAEIEAMGHSVYPTVLLTRVPTQSGDGAAARAALAQLEIPVMDPDVREVAMYHRIYGHVIGPDDWGDYVGVLDQIRADARRLAEVAQ